MIRLLDVRQASLENLIGASPIWVRYNQPPITDHCMGGDNKIHEASGREILGRNVSEGVEPRNSRRQRGRQFPLVGRLHNPLRKGEYRIALSGSEATA
jgi:hypothetical protein